MATLTKKTDTRVPSAAEIKAFAFATKSQFDPKSAMDQHNLDRLRCDLDPIDKKTWDSYKGALPELPKVGSPVTSQEKPKYLTDAVGDKALKAKANELAEKEALLRQRELELEKKEHASNKDGKDPWKAVDDYNANSKILQKPGTPPNAQTPVAPIPATPPISQTPVPPTVPAPATPPVSQTPGTPAPTTPPVSQQDIDALKAELEGLKKANAAIKDPSLLGTLGSAWSALTTGTWNDICNYAAENPKKAAVAGILGATAAGVTAVFAAPVVAGVATLTGAGTLVSMGVAAGAAALAAGTVGVAATGVTGVGLEAVEAVNDTVAPWAAPKLAAGLHATGEFLDPNSTKESAPLAAGSKPAPDKVATTTDKQVGD